jgi:hypothetical protein
MMLSAKSYTLIVCCRSSRFGIPQSIFFYIGERERLNPGEMPELAEGARLEIVCA